MAAANDGYHQKRTQRCSEAQMTEIQGLLRETLHADSGPNAVFGACGCPLCLEMLVRL
jgi:hypothetical protein